MAISGFSHKKLALFQALARQQGLKETKGFPVDPEKRSGPSQLSFAQEGLWVLQQIYPDDPAYNEHFALRIKGQLDEPALEWSLNQVVARHDVLRSTFAAVNGTTLQTPTPELFIPLIIEDVFKMPDADRQQAAMELAALEARTPFNLTNGPLVRTKLIRIRDDESQLLLTIHHIAIDGWSYGIFLREVAAAYEARVAGSTLDLPPLPAQYSDFARWQREHCEESQEAAELEYWTGQLAGASATTLVLRTSTAGSPNSAGRQMLLLEPTLKTGIQKLAQQSGTTVFMIWIAALTALMARYTGENDITTGTPTSVRPHRALEELIGIFVNTLALRVRFDHDATFQDLLRSVHATCIEAFAHQNVPFERVVQAIHSGHLHGGNPLFQTIFAINEVPHLSFGKLDVALVDVHNGGAKRDLNITLREDRNVSRISFEYRRAIFDDAAIQAMGQHLLTLLKSALQDVSQRISDLPLLTEEERRQVVEEWNRSEADYPQRCVPELFEEQVRRNPAAVAVEYEGERLSYRELNRRANQVGHYLRKQGVGPEVRVGICMERSLEMVVGLLGILKA